MRCPYCHSTNVEKTIYHYVKKGTVAGIGTVASIGLGVLVGALGGPNFSYSKGLDVKSGVDFAEGCNDEYECKSCGREFTIEH